MLIKIPSKKHFFKKKKKKDIYFFHFVWKRKKSFGFNPPILQPILEQHEIILQYLVIYILTTRCSALYIIYDYYSFGSLFKLSKNGIGSAVFLDSDLCLLCVDYISMCD